MCTNFSKEVRLTKKGEVEHFVTHCPNATCGIKLKWGDWRVWIFHAMDMPTDFAILIRAARETILISKFNLGRDIPVQFMRYERMTALHHVTSHQSTCISYSPTQYDRYPMIITIRNVLGAVKQYWSNAILAFASMRLTALDAVLLAPLVKTNPCAINSVSSTVPPTCSTMRMSCKSIMGVNFGSSHSCFVSNPCTLSTAIGANNSEFSATTLLERHVSTAASRAGRSVNETGSVVGCGVSLSCNIRRG